MRTRERTRNTSPAPATRRRGYIDRREGHLEVHMPGMSRREFMAGGLAATMAARLRASPLGLPIGSQTYPHRQMIKDGDFAGLLKILKEIGVEAVELCSAFGYAEFAPLSDARAVKKTLDEHGMNCESAHFSMREM